MIFRKFETGDFDEYRSWYADQELNRHLGPPPDQEWLDCIMNETDSNQLCFLRGESLVAVVGVHFPDDEHPVYTITDLAVKPEIRGQQIGSSALDSTLNHFNLKPEESWQVFIDERNSGAQSFFRKQGWNCTQDQPNEHGMLRFAKREPIVPEPHKTSSD